MKNILILTVDCWNRNIGATSSYTYSSLFSTVEGYNISNIYIREDFPDDPCCKRYFQISENRVLKSLLKRNLQTGREVFCSEPVSKENLDIIASQKRLYTKHRAHFYYAKKLMRELLWWMGSWKSKELDAFIDSVTPDVVIFTMEGYIHFNRICRYVLEKTGAKGIGYFWDDNFTYQQRPGNFGYKALRFFQRQSLIKLRKKTAAFWAIAPKTKKEADDFFGINCQIISKPSEREPIIHCANKCELPIRILYAGNLMIGRMDTIRILAEVLKEINQAHIQVHLDIYTSTVIPDDLKKFGYGVFFHEPVSQAYVLDLQNRADVLLFVEDLEGKDKLVSRLSFSTKIPDYLSSGKCILAIGCKDTAPMEYFYHENVALCASSKGEITEKIKLILKNTDILQDYGIRACKCALKNHNKEKIQETLTKSIESICEK